MRQYYMRIDAAATLAASSQPRAALWQLKLAQLTQGFSDDLLDTALRGVGVLERRGK